MFLPAERIVELQHPLSAPLWLSLIKFRDSFQQTQNHKNTSRLLNGPDTALEMTKNPDFSYMFACPK